MSMLPPDPIYIFKGTMESVFCLAFKITPYVEHIYAGTQTGIVHVWNLKTKRELGNFKIGDESCLSINIYEDYVITQDKCGCISLWEETDKWSFVKKIETDFFGFCKSCIFDNIIYSSLKNGKIQVLSIKTLEPVNKLNLTDGVNLGEIMAVKVFEINGQKLILVAFEGNQLNLFDEVKRLSVMQLEGCPMAVDFDVNSMKGICGDPSDKILIFSLSTSLDFKSEKYVKLVNSGVASLQIRPDSKVVAVGCWDGKLRLYSWKTLVLLAVLDTHSATVQDVCFSKGWRDAGKSKYLLAAGSKDSRISLWDLYN